MHVLGLWQQFHPLLGASDTACEEGSLVVCLFVLLPLTTSACSHFLRNNEASFSHGLRLSNTEISNLEDPLYLNINKSSSSREWASTNSFHPYLRNNVSSIRVNPTFQVAPLGPVRLTEAPSFSLRLLTIFLGKACNFIIPC